MTRDKYTERLEELYKLAVDNKDIPTAVEILRMIQLTE